MSIITYTLNCADVEIEFDFWKGYDATWEEPGCDDDCEINAVMYQGIDIMPTVAPDDLEAMYIYILESAGKDDD